MGGSSSQPHMQQPMSHIHSFPNEDMYKPEFFEDMYQNTACEDSPVEVTTHLAPAQPKSSQRGWIRMRMHPGALYGPMRKKLRCVKGKRKAPGHRTYDMVNAKWQTVRWNMARFRGVHANVMLRAHANGAGDEDCFTTALLDFEAEFEKKDAKRSNTSGFSSFYTKSGDASINLNVNAGDDDEDEVHELQRPISRDKAKGSKKKGTGSSGTSSSMNDEALARLTVSELAMHNERAMSMMKE
ncbi:hypothetical protein Tco_0969858 [Tanacetum coccineum]